MPTSDKQLSAVLIELADTLVSDYELLDYLDRLIERSTMALDAVAGGVLLSDAAGELQLLASSDERQRFVGLLELQRHEGPCIDSFRANEQVVAEDLAASTRWPQFAPAALEAGFRAAFAFPLRLRNNVIGALNLYRDRPGPVDAVDAAVAQAFADMATIGILQERAVREARVLAGHLQTALNSRIVIEQAKGILAERLHMDMGDAWETLRGYARRSNLRVRDVAAALVNADLTADAVVGHPRSQD